MLRLVQHEKSRVMSFRMMSFVLSIVLIAMRARRGAGYASFIRQNSSPQSLLQPPGYRTFGPWGPRRNVVAALEAVGGTAGTEGGPTLHAVPVAKREASISGLLKLRRGALFGIHLGSVVDPISCAPR